MSLWKVLLIAVFALVCLALATSIFVIPFNYTGGERWLWLFIMIAATAGAPGLFSLFSRYASKELLLRERG